MVLKDGRDQSETGRHSQKGKEATKHDKVFRGGGGGGGGDMWKEKVEEEKKDKVG